jgi:ADP-ribosylglycohydrolase
MRGGAGRRSREFYRGCLLGGAVGDALGAPVEFLQLGAIQARFGPEGIVDFSPAYGRLGAITDDTQMTLFTAEGLLRAKCRASHKGLCSVDGVVHHAYTRWLRTQSHQPGKVLGPVVGWLFDLRELHDSRAPGNTCLSALMSPEPGTRERPLNDSKGCGGVMRMAPAGLVQDADSFELGCTLAAITHGHPTGYLAAGAFAAMVRALIEGCSLLDAVETGRERLAACRGHQECTDALDAALELWRRGPASADRVAELGHGWVAEEALAIGVYCALAAGEDFAAGVRLAVNHSGDSDSTGAIAGNLLGAALGVSAIPSRWLDALELRAEIEALADDVLTWFRGDEEWWARYPGW